MIRLLIGGSPCTQSKGRETKAEGLGWELFENYVIAKEKFQPDFFLYENNWSASKEIKEQIQKELGHELMRINSSLVSAQNRDRFYVFNREVEAADVAPVVHAKWEHTHTSESYFIECWRCSACGFDDTEGFDFKFCPECGAKMDGENDVSQTEHD